MSEQSRLSINYKVKVTSLSVLLLIFLLLTILIFVGQSNHKNNFDQYMLAASEQQVLAHKISQYAVESGAGNESSFDRLKESSEQSNYLMTEMMNGSVEKDLPAAPSYILPKLLEVNDAWQILKTHVESILASQIVIVQADEIITRMKDSLPNLISSISSVADKLIIKGNNTQVYHITSQLFISERIYSNLGEVLDGGLTTVFALDQLTQNIDNLEVSISNLIEGSEDIKLLPVKDANSLAELKEIIVQLEQMRGDQNDLLGMIAELLPALTALGSLDENIDDEGLRSEDATAVLAIASDNLAKLDADLIAQYNSLAGNIIIGNIQLGEGVMMTMFLLTALIFTFLSYLLVTTARNREKQTAKINDSNQKAIRQLLSEMSDLANGDLTIEATVTENITGAIADSINVSVESMRDVVVSINETSTKVSTSGEKNQSTINQLIQAAEFQGNDITNASELSTTLGETLKQMSEKSVILAEVAVQSQNLAHSGGSVVFKNITGMEKLREQIQGTSKRIKRLGESSQEIGSIVGLINGITDQTNILAMNASMQAAAAGDAGHGFAIVADEVQRLAERSANAVKQIETLVNAIQADTSEAVVSMESSITEVLNGATLAEEAGKVLKDIEKASQQVTEDTTGIAESAKHQSDNATTLKQTMEHIQQLTEQLSTGIKSTVSGIVYQVDNVKKLRNSVAEFKLPAES